MEENEKVDKVKSYDEIRRNYENDNLIATIFAVIVFVAIAIFSCVGIAIIAPIVPIILGLGVLCFILKNISKIFKFLSRFFKKTYDFSSMFFKKTYDFLKQKFGTLFLFINKILNSRILTNVLLIIVLCELLGIIDAIPRVHNIYESEITDAVEKALRRVFYRY